jgi:hypothetical protein
VQAAPANALQTDYIRETSRERKGSEPRDVHFAKTVAIDSMQSPRNQWQVMLEGLRATG